MDFGQREFAITSSIPLMSEIPLLEVQDLSCSKDQDEYIFSDVKFSVKQGDIIVIQGKSGSGKTTLLKCLAHLTVYTGQIYYRGRTPKSCGIPAYRTRVLYVPQRPSLLPGSPRDFIKSVSSFQARSIPNSRNKDALISTNRPIDIAEGWGIEEHLWDRDWSNLSGGEAQRIALAVAVGLNAAEVLLLDEPTSALDPQSSMLVEEFLTHEIRSDVTDSPLKAVVWITHSEEQGRRVGTRFLNISNGSCHELSTSEV